MGFNGVRTAELMGGLTEAFGREPSGMAGQFFLYGEGTRLEGSTAGLAELQRMRSFRIAIGQFK